MLGRTGFSAATASWRGPPQLAVADPDSESALNSGRVGVVLPLQIEAYEAQMSVMAVTRLANDLFQVKVADDSIYRLFAELLRSLPQDGAMLVILVTKGAFSETRTCRRTYRSQRPEEQCQGRGSVRPTM